MPHDMMGLVLLTALAGFTPAVPAPPTNCSAPEYRQLDFRIGAWNVSAPPDKTVADSSHIEKVLEGCAISEFYESPPQAPGGAYAGKSYSAYDRKDGKWHQLYVDTHGNTSWFTGGLVGRDMVLVAPGPGGGLQRMTYSPQADGSVLQTGAVSMDGGKTWRPSDAYLVYRRK